MTLGRLCLGWALIGVMVMGCGHAVEAPAAPEPPVLAIPALHDTEPAGRSLELRLDDATLGFVAIAELAEPVRLNALLPPPFPSGGWYSVDASAGQRTFHLEESVASQTGAVPWLRSQDGAISLVFLRPASPNLPEHIRKLAAVPVARFDGAAVVHVRSQKPEFDEPERVLLVVTLDGRSHGVADSALQAFPALGDPRRPDKDGNWRSLEAVLASLPGPDTTSSEVVVISGDEPLALSPDLRRSHTVLLKRNLKGRVRLRVYPPGEGKRKPVHDVGNVLQIRVRGVGSQRGKKTHGATDRVAPSSVPPHSPPDAP